MAPKYRLIYFNARGRAETIRLILAAAGVDYEDVRIEKDKWPELKSTVPFGQIPVLEVNGKYIAQSVAIARYLAKEHGLAGKDNFEDAQIDQIAMTCYDIMNLLIPYITETNPDKKKEIGLKFVSETLPPYLDRFEKLLKANNGGKGYFVGDKLTWADIAVAQALHALYVKLPAALDGHPQLKGLLERVVALPKIKAWIDKRPVTDM